MDEYQNDPQYMCMSNRFKRQQLRIKWDNLTITQKDKYIAMSLNDRKQYFDQLQHAQSDHDQSSQHYDQDNNNIYNLAPYEILDSMHQNMANINLNKIIIRSRTRGRTRTGTGGRVRA